MEAIILCGGKATRLGELTKEKPKSLVEVAGVPFLERQLQILEKNGFENIVISAGHLYQAIEEFVYSRKNKCDIGVAIEADPLLTGGATKYSMQFCREEHACVIWRLLF